LKKSKHEKPKLVQLVIGTKKKINLIVNGFPLDMNGIITIVYLNMVSLGSYDVLIGMDRLDVHHAILDCRNKTFNCLGEEGK
jgi:hypothetical protein